MGMLFLWESHGKRPMRWDRHNLLWDGTDKYVPWTTLGIAPIVSVLPASVTFDQLFLASKINGTTIHTGKLACLVTESRR